MAKIKVRYTGTYPVTLKDPGSVLGANGRPVTKGNLEVGDVILMEKTEILGATFYEDVIGSGKLRLLGPGRVILKKDEQRRDADLPYLGYQFHMGRTDFEPVDPVSRERTILDEAPPVVDETWVEIPLEGQTPTEAGIDLD